MKVEVAVPGSPSLNSPYGLCGRKATMSLTSLATAPFLALTRNVLGRDFNTEGGPEVKMAVDAIMAVHQPATEWNPLLVKLV